MTLRCLKHPGGWTLCFPADSPVADAERLATAVTNEATAAPLYLKDGNGVRVYRSTAAPVDGQDVVVKKFVMRHLRERIKSWRFGPREFSNHQRAQELGLPVPRLLGQFEQRSWGLVRLNGVIMEYLHDYLPLCPAEFQQAAPLLLRLWELGANHIDLSPTNILRHRATGELKILDWQYASFVTPRDPRQLLLQAAHFLELSGLPPEHPVFDGFLGTLHDACCPDHEKRAAFRAAVTTLARTHQSRKTRLALLVSDTLLEPFAAVGK